MSDITRHEPSSFLCQRCNKPDAEISGLMISHPEGRWVRYEDYAALLAENERIRKLFEATERLTLLDGEYEAAKAGTYNRLNDELQRLLAATQWRPIETAYTEYLKGKDVLLLFDNGKVESASVSEGAGVWSFSTHDGCNVMVQYDGVTHWMPLPNPPVQ